MSYSAEKIRRGLGKYMRIMALVQKTDVSIDQEFQHLFNGFYRVRQRPAAFYKCYYQFLEAHKNDTLITYEEILLHLYHELGRIEASFSSKLLATICPDRPVWDVYVLQNLGLKPPYYGDKSRFKKVVALYDAICTWYQSDDAYQKLQEFDLRFPGVQISNTKKIDLILWQTRSDKV